ncbi:peptidase M28-like protein [Hydrogenoanaerobacterium saccharovorans]|uniref:Peptidase family M28 n=1 Tax=Hydrogenoanaerobacterium saccharovorans TaxID=474960 RepID=A0A1H8E2Y7_9FIRM|nr:M28 family peptidase [Hydrogenoanaerobacterium saccharovorans]RPF42108.1 peptidase M28-like protein [Hydrogenoanaerobacterium saccharovorans]SEN13810.1 Peptidase family M28 [Hydrogenoanaerobacterium saccharovorans]
MKYKTILLLSVVFIFVGCSNHAVKLEKHVELTDDSYLRTVIETIAKNPRFIGSENEKQVAAFIADELQDMGYDITYQQFKFQLPSKENNLFLIEDEDYFTSAIHFKGKADGKSQNIIGAKAETKRKKTLIISVNYDSVDGSCGANYNGSGTAVALQLAQLFQEIDLPFQLKFVFFTGESEQMLGSRYYVGFLNEKEVQNIIGNISVNLVSYDTLDDLCILTGKMADDRKSGVKNKMSNLFPEHMRIVPNRFSDHYSFFMKDIDSISLTQNFLKSTDVIHGKDDSISKINYESLCNVTNMIVEAIYHLEEES